MSHRKFEHPRYGSKGFLPRRRTRHHRGRVRSFPKDDASKAIHLTAFMGYKAGSTHIVKSIERREGKKLVKRDIVHPATIVECPPMKVIGVVGYVQTPRGLRALSTVYAQQLDDDVKRRFYRNWNIAKKKAFTKYADKYKDGNKNTVKRDLERIKKYCAVVRVLCATQVGKLNLRQKKAHVFEVQVNGGTVAQKVDWAQGKFEQEVRISEVFEENECLDCVGVTKGHGTQGVIKRFKVKRL
jgi:large subunit ribosomal protein L3e